jgi:hypothetical protein
MLEKVQRKFARFIYKRMYGYYPYLFPSLFVLGMVGLDSLELRRKLLLIVHYYSLLHGTTDNPCVLGRVGLAVPPPSFGLAGASVGGARPARRIRRLLAGPATRTRHAANAPTARAISLINHLLNQVPDADIFNDKLSKLTKAVMFGLNVTQLNIAIKSGIHIS